MSVPAREYITLEQYFALEERGERKHEYERGAIYAMTGGTARHNLKVLH